ncbi:MAG: hypothetical protein CVV39_08545 [Planctomycetes bacterium HGW-Planctomycetes-1]|nr:MAG: hypothetical protein CVV39_08545 [Planctomycetes bacterium HGW-Planctomycetes-1]
MADKFVSSAGPKGTGDGSSEENAWSLANALSNTSAGDYIWLKNDGVYAGTFTVNCSGSYTANTHIVFIGYNDINNCDLVKHISDMDYGQAFWGGPLKPNAENCWVNIDGQGAAGNVVYQSSKHNIHWRNVHFHNTNGLSGNDAYECRASRNVTWTKCKFTDAYFGLYLEQTCHNVLVDYCYFGNNIRGCHFGSGYHSALRNCVMVIPAGNVGLIMYDTLCENSVFIGGAYAIGAQYYRNTVRNCVLYNQTSYCVVYGHNTYVSGLIEFNNIYSPLTKDLPAIYKEASGSITYGGYSCAYCIADDSVLDTPYDGQNGMNVNPMLIDPDNMDFRPRNPVVLRGGKGDFTGEPSQIGAVLQKYQFISKARAVNLGRLAIIR